MTDAGRWARSAALPPLDGDVHLWLVESGDRGVVNEALRTLLGGYLGLDPGSISLVASDGGKPRLDGDPLRFNLSHTGGLGLIALSRAAEVGVDVERVRPGRDFERLAARVMTPAERAAFETVDPGERAGCLHQVWARKEAVLKLRGTGVGGAVLNRLEVPLEPLAAEHGASLGSIGSGDEIAELFHVAPGSGVAGALAVGPGTDGSAEVGVVRLRSWSFPPG